MTAGNRPLPGPRGQNRPRPDRGDGQNLFGRDQVLRAAEDAVRAGYRQPEHFPPVSGNGAERPERHQEKQRRTVAKNETREVRAQSWTRRFVSHLATAKAGASALVVWAVGFAVAGLVVGATVCVLIKMFAGEISGFAITVTLSSVSGVVLLGGGAAAILRRRGH